MAPLLQSPPVVRVGAQRQGYPPGGVGRRQPDLDRGPGHRRQQVGEQGFGVRPVGSFEGAA
jgi:hypothetical protein